MEKSRALALNLSCAEIDAMASGVFKKRQEKAVCCFPGEGGRVGKKRLLQYPPAYRSPL
jgi:hypothetical protein